MNVCWNNVNWLNNVFYSQERPRVVVRCRIRIEWLGYIFWGELLKQQFVRIDDISLEKKEKCTYLILPFQTRVVVYGSCLRSNLHPTTEFGSLQWGSSILEIRGYIKTAEWKTWKPSGWKQLLQGLGTCSDSNQIPILEDNVNLPTTAPGAGYVFRLKSDSDSRG